MIVIIGIIILLIIVVVKLLIIMVIMVIYLIAASTSLHNPRARLVMRLLKSPSPMSVSEHVLQARSQRAVAHPRW